MRAVAYQGEPGAYGEEAVFAYFGEEGIEGLCLPTFSAVCDAVVDGRAVAALLPLENSIAGTVGEAVDALMRADLAVSGELLLPVRHQLLALPGVALASITRVASHRQALAQCEGFLAGGGWQPVVAEDTAGAARQLREAGDRTTAVIASRRSAARYGLEVLASDIQDAAANLTRFVVVTPSGTASRAHDLPPPVGPLAPDAAAPVTCLIAFETRHRPGALHRALGSFAEAGVNLSRIESRPTGRAQWEYRFLVSVDGHHATEPLASALASLAQLAHDVRVLGSFPSAG